MKKWARCDWNKATFYLYDFQLFTRIYVEPTGKLFLWTDVSRGHCPPCTPNPWGYFSYVLLSYKEYIFIATVIYIVWLPSGSQHCLQMQDSCYSHEYHSSISFWKSWVLGYPKTLLWWIYKWFDRWSCRFIVCYISGIVHACLYTCIFLVTPVVLPTYPHVLSS